MPPDTTKKWIIRPHKKTKTGCKTCRKRRIKCDEAVPYCGNCQKRDVECVWDEKNPTQGINQQLSVARNPSPPGELPLNLLETMHHYSTISCFTLEGYGSTSTTAFWKGTVPSLAFDQHAHQLLQAVMAFSSFHLARIHTDEDMVHRHRVAAEKHLRYARDSILAPGTNVPVAPDGAGINFLTNMLVSLCNLAVTDSPLSPDWWLFLRLHLNHDVVQRMWPQYSVSRLTPLFTAMSTGHYQTLEIFGGEQLTVSYIPAVLCNIHTPSARFPDNDEVGDTKVSSAYREAVSALKWPRMQSECVGFEFVTIIGWLSRVPDKYLTLLGQKRPRALIISAHFCAIIARMAASREMPWWVPNWKIWRKEVERIRGMVGSSWEPWFPDLRDLQAKDENSDGRIDQVYDESAVCSRLGKDSESDGQEIAKHHLAAAVRNDLHIPPMQQHNMQGTHDPASSSHMIQYRPAVHHHYGAHVLSDAPQTMQQRAWGGYSIP
ncbi:hypothetical protein CYLTODRAFT_454088 [Cylindrobasidium torrendii FP15055 ss-10]|uniref:Zn(2)-C6 fungal-type domain-containing protein n=1 Tax=Cylindrobasidium torrendii FP15055 ss-10 TaxID=1314674 RepID=A0A0D7BCI2_9AGAR|nr:hypothetical protein CYLTODRAFT_454088 [Cylindrobasidium torrendii FP15055 ss-10]